MSGSPINFYIEYLAVLDYTVYNKYTNLFNTYSTDIVIQFMRIQYSHLISAVRKLDFLFFNNKLKVLYNYEANIRYQNSLAKDPDIQISIKLTNIIIYTVKIIVCNSKKILRI